MDIGVDDNADWHDTRVPHAPGRRISRCAPALAPRGKLWLDGARLGAALTSERTMMQVHTRLLAAIGTIVVASTLSTGAQYKLTVSQDRLNNAHERAPELAVDERRLRLDAVLEAHADQPRQRQEPADGLGAWRSGGCRTSGRTARRTKSIRSSTTASCTRPTAGARSTRSTHATRTRASSSGLPIAAVRHEGNCPAHARHRPLGGPGRRQPA